MDERGNFEQDQMSGEELILEDNSEEVWKKAEPILIDWKDRLSEYEEKHRLQIQKVVLDIAKFFGKEAPNKTNVDIHFLAQKNSSKGEPASGLVNQMRLPGGDSDVFYWLGEAIRMPKDGPKEYEEEVRRETTKVIHEIVHQEFQGDNPVFKNSLEQANSDEDVLARRQDLMGNQANYLEPEAEMTAIYFERFAKKILQSEEVESPVLDKPMIVYRVDKKRFKEIFKAVVKENESEKWKNGGPYKKLVDGWRKVYEEDEISKPVKFLTESEQKRPEELSIYELGETITDFSLIEGYIQENRQLDLNFIKELYNLFLKQRGI